MSENNQSGTGEIAAITAAVAAHKAESKGGETKPPAGTPVSKWERGFCAAVWASAVGSLTALVYEKELHDGLARVQSTVDSLRSTLGL